MKFRSVSIPGESKGIAIKGKRLVRPDQALSLVEILARFSRGEPLSIGKESTYYEDSEDDLEKLPYMDLVDKQEYIEKMKKLQRDYDSQEKRKEAAFKAVAEKKALDDARQKFVDEQKGKVIP